MATATKNKPSPTTPDLNEPDEKPTGSATLPPAESDDQVPDDAASPSESEFVFHPEEGEPITVPRVTTAIPAGKHRWFFWKLRKLQGLEQPIFWLEQAQIPESVQEQIMLLPDAEWGRFFEEWMSNSNSSDGDSGGATLGE